MNNEFQNLPETLGLFLLDQEHHLVKPDSVLSWARWMESANRVVAQTVIRVLDDVKEEEVLVSTVFLGLNHNFRSGDADPITFETMIFGGDNDGYQRRYRTWDEAFQSHYQVAAEESERQLNRHRRLANLAEQLEHLKLDLFCPKCGGTRAHRIDCEDEGFG